MLAFLAPPVFRGQTLLAGAEWLPAVGLNLTFRLDGLGLLFGILILGIGLLVILYAHYYLSERDATGRFYGFLLLFMGAMLGLVLAENLLLLLVFWELTSLASFLLPNLQTGQTPLGAYMRLGSQVEISKTTECCTDPMIWSIGSFKPEWLPC